MQAIDAAIMWNNNKAYFFGGSEYIRYDVATDRADGGYPLAIAGNWPGLWQNGIQAALNNGNGKAYFFRGSEYVKYDMAQDHVDAGYPLSISGHWPGLWDSDIQAAVKWPDGKVYFFRGREYVRYDMAADKVDPGYPRPIKDHWPGLFEENIIAALPWTNGKVYFFSGSQYSRYDVAADRVDLGYPLPIKDHWPGVIQPATGGGVVDSDGNRLLQGGVWNGPATVRVQGGQSMHFQMKNLNVLGVTVRIVADRTGETRALVILPGGTGDIIFQQFGVEPMGWTFNVSTDSDAMIVGWQLFSTWIPGD